MSWLVFKLDTSQTPAQALPLEPPWSLMEIQNVLTVMSRGNNFIYMLVTRVTAVH
jgi:hypothetical protein